MIRDNERAGIAAGMLWGSRAADRGGRQGHRRQDSTIVERCVIAGNSSGVIRTEGHVRLSDCSISGNHIFGIWNWAPEVSEIVARWNWWGHPTGPGGEGSGQGDPVSEGVAYYPWRTGGRAIAGSSRDYPTQWNNARRIVRDECPPSYKVVFTDESGVFITMVHHPDTGEWLDPIEVWPVDFPHHSSDPGIAIARPQPEDWCRPYPKLHLVWSDHIPDEEQPGEIYYCFSEDGGFTWSEPQNLSNSETASEHPAIAIDGTDVVHIVWEEHIAPGPEIIYISNAGGDWTDPVNVSGTPDASIFATVAANYEYTYGEEPGGPAAPDDRVHVAWTEFVPPPWGGEVPWIAYRSWDPTWSWIPALEDLPEDATGGTGGAFASIIAYPSPFEVGRAPAVAWHWPYDPEDPPILPSAIYFNDRTPGVWGVPRPITGPAPHESPSRFVSLAPQAGAFEDSLWAAWEEWDLGTGRSEVHSAYSTDLGESWQFYINLSQTRWDGSLRPSLAYKKGTTFTGCFDICWTELELDQEQPQLCHVYYIGATALVDSVAASIPEVSQHLRRRLHTTCHPNPTTGRVALSVHCRSTGLLCLTIHDVQGRVRRVLTRTKTHPGRQLFEWDGRDGVGQLLPPGLYFARVTVAGQVGRERIVIIR